MTGRLAKISITDPNTDTQIYQVPVGNIATVTLNVCNKTGSVIRIRVAVTDSTSIGSEEYLDYNIPIYPYESYQRSGIVLGSSQYLYVRGDAGGLSVNVWGFEEEA